jgi:uncharacterized protein
MDNNNFYNITGEQKEAVTASKTFMAGVFSWMFLALTITAIISYVFGTNLEYVRFMISETGGLSMMGYVVMFAPLGFVLLMSLGFNKLSYPVLLALFIAYSAIMGVSLSFIFLAYTMSSIYMTFAISAGMFGLMAVMGYTTKTDLTKFGSIMMMGLFGIIIASIVNMFMQSDSMSYVISFIGVVVFTGLTAYDVQKLKRIGAEVQQGTEVASKATIMGALTLYLDFINLFLMLLRLFGSRK